MTATFTREELLQHRADLQEWHLQQTAKLVHALRRGGIKLEQFFVPLPVPGGDDGDVALDLGRLAEVLSRYDGEVPYPFLTPPV